MGKSGSLSVSQENARLHKEREKDAALCFLELKRHLKALEVLLVIWKAVLKNKVCCWEGYTHHGNRKHFYTLLKHILVIVRSLDLH